ncbi:hypothetical protein HPC38_01420 [Pasteurellaceae bacterium HPA106]|uniref:phage adaptor protein n=1 Tax=Spirabiliibacterium pneumoniae TaxID=221400 RepID=UPI001AACDF3D|nr:DUF6682 family protein [Spirabiliibacterium pneumoniae]MBE2895537.1 hypothetical protein [Spirabiliibacterium pneumoniae]
MKLSSIINELRMQLNDAESLGFSDELLEEWIEDGLCMIYSLVPDQFKERIVIQAEAGTVQCAACCDKLISVDGQSDACGNVIEGVKIGDVNSAMRFKKKNIPHLGQYTVSIRNVGNNLFDVYPPIRSDEEVYFLVTCANPLSIVRDENGEAELPDCKHHQALIHYVLYRAYSVESESQTSRAIADQEYRYFFELMGIERNLSQGVVNNAASS